MALHNQLLRGQVEATRTHIDLLRSPAGLTVVVWRPIPSSGEDMEQVIPAGGGDDDDGVSV
jgi:hypothetical protein